MVPKLLDHNKQGALRDNTDDGNKNGEKAIGLYQQNNFACASPIFVHFLATVT